MTSLTVAAVTLALGPTASADPTEPTAESPRAIAAAVAAEAEDDPRGRGAGTERSVDPVQRAAVLRRVAETAVAGDPIEMPTSYPYQPDLRIYRDNNDDAADTAALITHPEIAPTLLDLMERSDRVSTQVVGQSTEGRDLYLVTVTAPETEEQTADQAEWKRLIKDDPEAAAADTALRNGYKTPIWISNNIHGNEWEGTDAAMQYIEYLATAPIREVGGILANNRIYFSPSLNPDGRTNATRATALGLDPNRDMITNTTPETKSFIRQAQAIQPIYAADFHGYTNVLQMEPTGPPHGSNYEYDLYVPHNYALALKVERDVVAAAIPGNTYFNVTTRQVVAQNTSADTAHIKIPYRDTPDGWDDFPPIFTAQYAAFYGAASATVELPLTRNLSVNGTSRISPERAAINTAVALQTMKSTIGYLNIATNAREMLANQIEVFRRGVEGEKKDNLTVSKVGPVPGPAQWKPLWDVADDQEPIVLPRAYVIPVGDDQRSASDAADLVDHLVLHDIEVGRLTADATVEGTTYPAGSYVVDMHQPLRGLANALLDLGEDISPKVPSMYDISAWSLGKIWGATVDKVGLTESTPAVGTTEPVTAATAPTAPAAADYVTFDVAGVSDYQVLNSLLDQGVKVSMLEDGSAVVDRAGFDAALAAASEAGVDLEAASAADLDALDDETTKPLSDLTIAYVGTQDDRLSLTELGFDDLRVVTAASLQTNPALMDGVDVLWVGGSFNPSATTQTAARTAVQTFLDNGGALIGRTANALVSAQSFGQMTGTTSVNSVNSANGIVAVDTPEGSVLEPYAQDTSFIYPAVSFPVLGTGVVAAQSYDADKPFLAGHWRGTEGGTNTSAFAAGKPSVVSYENPTSGAKSLVFGTSVFFRTHPKGGLSQAARAIFWGGPEGEPVVAPVAPTATTTTVAPVATTTYPAVPTVTVTTAAGEATTPGTVDLLSGDRVVASAATAADGTATISLEGARPGTVELTARFTPTSELFEASTSAPFSVTIDKAVSAVSVKAQSLPSGPKAKKGKVRLTVALGVAGVPTNGRLVITSAGLNRTVTVASGSSKSLTVWLPKGTRTVRVAFAGNGLVAPASAATTVRVR